MRGKGFVSWGGLGNEGMEQTGNEVFMSFQSPFPHDGEPDSVTMVQEFDLGCP